MNLTIVYGASNPRKRGELWEEIKTLSLDTSKPWLILGDFNEVRNKKERIGTKARVSLANIDAFNSCIEDSSLNELQSIGEDLSWHNMCSGDEMIASKIDRAFVNYAWMEKWPNTKSRLHRDGTSDHALLIVELGRIQS